jgi:alkylglycerol monooxygenase
MNINPVVLSIPIYFLLIGIELLIQAFSNERLYRLNDAITNISCGVTQQVTGVFFKVLSVAAYHVLFTHFAIWQIAPTWYNLVILFIAVDFCYYWAHRMSHEINLFWGGHVVHHQSEDYNFSVALRQGSFQIVWTFMFYLPLAIIGFDTLNFVLMSGLVTVYQFWIHTEKIGKLGPIEWIFNTPSHHRVHHGRDPKYIDKNHAGVFIIWDKLFGTYQVEEERPTYGITKPINSWNPVWVNLDHYAQMARQWGQFKGFKNKWNLLFNKPGWQPDELGGQLPIPEVEKSSYVKYDEKIDSPMLSWYILAQYLVILLVTALFLFNEAKFPLHEKVIFSSLVIWGVVSCGAIFERKNWINFTEVLRIFTYALVAFFFTPIAQNVLLPLIFAYIILSLGWFYKAKAAFLKIST